MTDTTLRAPAQQAGADVNYSLVRSLNWTHAFWFAAGTPALVLFSVGAIAATAGNISPLVWTISALFGFVQAFTYAEISSMYPHKSGGASVYGALAWVRYGKMLGPISVWSNWFSWSPVLAIGTGLGAGYILNLFFPADHWIQTWQITLVDLSFLKEGLSLRVNSVFVLGWLLVLTVFAVQHRGVLKAANLQKLLAITALAPLIIIGLVPILSGSISVDNFMPFVPLGRDAAGNPVAGAWDMAGWTVFAGALFIAGWSTYAFETAVCYTREFRNPGKDTPKSLIAAGLLCVVVFSLVPLAFQGTLGLNGMLDPGIYSGMGVADAMAGMIGASVIVTKIIVVLLILALLLTVSMSMAGSARTLYQGSVDGWLPRYLSRVNSHGAPVAGMWTDLGFNMLLLMMSDYVFLLAIANVNYMIFNFLNLQSGWLHRIDRPEMPRPYRAPNLILAAGAVLGFVNLLLLGMGANIWGPGTLAAGFAVALMILPVFAFRHFVVDGGKFPKQTFEDFAGADETEVKTRAGILPYLTLIAGVSVIAFGYYIAVY
ncbi:MAG: APC family permease [Rhizobiales bacterium]|nr:APC family permease [Hyphomicrobiales bacterium]